MRIIVQKAVIKVIKPQVVRYECDWCGDICGTRDNPKETWYHPHSGERHYCKRKGCKAQEWDAWAT